MVTFEARRAIKAPRERREVWSIALVAHQRAFGFDIGVFERHINAGVDGARQAKDSALACWALAQKQELEAVAPSPPLDKQLEREPERSAKGARL